MEEKVKTKTTCLHSHDFDERSIFTLHLFSSREEPTNLTLTTHISVIKRKWLTIAGPLAVEVPPAAQHCELEEKFILSHQSFDYSNSIVLVFIQDIKPFSPHKNIME